MFESDQPEPPGNCFGIQAEVQLLATRKWNRNQPEYHRYLDCRERYPDIHQSAGECALISSKKRGVDRQDVLRGVDFLLEVGIVIGSGVDSSEPDSGDPDPAKVPVVGEPVGAIGRRNIHELPHTGPHRKHLPDQLLQLQDQIRQMIAVLHLFRSLIPHQLCCSLPPADPISFERNTSPACNFLLQVSSEHNKYIGRT